ncbi:hypothetical protein [Clostridium saccharobutylicum]|uniref:hypothetical protein n=1 Tax=Clostridium saccharobutylicum TaxID=169679 RepID=UPI0007E3166A|nr:hypothetical protein [Clostridium saccharobutylicum]
MKLKKHHKKYISNVKERNTIKSFLYKDTYYKRSDIIILSYYNNEKKLYESKNAIKYDIGADLVISIEHSNIYKVIFNDNENEQITKEYENIGTNEIRDIYLQILDTFKT